MTWRRTSTSADTLTLNAVKEYLKINYNDEDQTLELLISASLIYVEKFMQKPVFDTAYTDFLEISDTVPAEAGIAQTDAPTNQPVVFYTDTGGIRTQYPPAEILYNYFPSERLITLDMIGDLPSVQENSLLEVQWTAAGVGPELSNNARLRLIAGWFENRESIAGSDNAWVSGVESLLSPISLVM